MYVTDNLLLNLNNKQLSSKNEVKSEKFNLKKLCYKSNDQFEKELFKIGHKEHIRQINPVIYEHVITYVSNPFIKQNNYVEENYTIKQYGDIEFINWLKTQTDPRLAIFAELINAPRLHLNIENQRQNVHNIKSLSINNYVKLKKWGTKQKMFLKELKQKYGNNILKFLYLSVN